MKKVEVRHLATGRVERISTAHAKVLVLLGRAEYVPAVLTPAPIDPAKLDTAREAFAHAASQPSGPVEVLEGKSKKPRRRYRRRDMQAED